MDSVKQSEIAPSHRSKIYKIFSIVELPGKEKNLWIDIGVGRLNRDESITCRLNCLPLNGVIQIRPRQ